jgi:hypothetical protein
LDFDDLQSAKNFGTLAQNCATSYLRVSSPAGCRARRHRTLPASQFRRDSLWRPKRRADCARALARQVFCDIARSRCRNYRLSRVLAGRAQDHRALLLQVPPDHAVGGGTRRPICFVAVAAQRGIGRLEGKWFAAALTPRTKGDALQLYDLHSTFLSFIVHRSLRRLSLIFNAISIIRRIASDRDGWSGCCLAHSSTRAVSAGGIRKAVTGSCPVAGRPPRRFCFTFCLTAIWVCVIHFDRPMARVPPRHRP